MDKKQLYCKECKKTFSHQGNLRRHIHAIHSLTIMKYICWYCNKSYKRQENARKHITSTHPGQEERITTKHFPNTKNKNTDYTIETFKPKPWTPPPEALTKTQYRIYVRSAQPKIYRALTIKQALTAVQGYSREADLLEDLYITPESSPASSTTDVMDERDLDGQDQQIHHVHVYGTFKRN